MAKLGRSEGLRTIFSFFLGVMLTAFIAVGVYTFLPPPDRFDREIRELSRQEREIGPRIPPDEITPSERDRLREIEERRQEIMEAAEAERQTWGRRTSIILVAFATLTMAVSLVRADQLPVISNGLLLGGVFTMLYGVGWIAFTDSSMARFLVISAALLITLGLGYLRFVRRTEAAPVPAGAASGEGLDPALVERRLRDLEERMDAAARSLLGKED